MQEVNQKKKNLVNIPDTVPVKGVLEAQDQVSFQTVHKNHKDKQFNV